MTGRPSPIFTDLSRDRHGPDERRGFVAEANARLDVGARLERGLDRMIAIQCEAYPASWPEADKIEAAEIHLFGRKDRGL